MTRAINKTNVSFSLYISSTTLDESSPIVAWSTFDLHLSQPSVGQLMCMYQILINSQLTLDQLGNKCIPGCLSGRALGCGCIQHTWSIFCRTVSVHPCSAIIMLVVVYYFRIVLTWCRWISILYTFKKILSNFSGDLVLSSLFQIKQWY